MINLESIRFQVVGTRKENVDLMRMINVLF